MKLSRWLSVVACIFGFGIVVPVQSTVFASSIPVSYGNCSATYTHSKTALGFTKFATTSSDSDCKSQVAAGYCVIAVGGCTLAVVDSSYPWSASSSFIGLYPATTHYICNSTGCTQDIYQF